MLSIFLYVSEIWAIIQIMWDKIEAFEMWLWRKGMKISYTEHKTNEEVLEIVREKNLFLKKLSQENFGILSILSVEMECKIGH